MQNETLDIVLLTQIKGAILFNYYYPPNCHNHLE